MILTGELSTLKMKSRVCKMLPSSPHHFPISKQSKWHHHTEEVTRAKANPVTPLTRMSAWRQSKAGQPDFRNEGAGFNSPRHRQPLRHMLSIETPFPPLYSFPDPHLLGLNEDVGVGWIQHGFTYQFLSHWNGFVHGHAEVREVI